MLTTEFAETVRPTHGPPKREFSVDHLSWSSVSTYAICPRKYYYHYVERVPQEFVPASLAFGGAFHEAVARIHQARFEKAAIPELEALMACFDEQWNQATGNAPVSHAKNENAQTLRTTAERMLSTYRSHAMAQAECDLETRPVAIEHAQRFRLHADLPLVQMRIDLLEVHGRDLIVTDIKTSRSRWNETKTKEALPQLVMYAAGLQPVLRELDATRIVPQFLVVTKAKAPVIQQLKPDIDTSDFSRLERQLFETWDGIQKQVFVQRPGWQCSQCQYKKRCLG